MSILSKLFSGRVKKREEASADEIPRVISQLQQSAQDGHFVVFMFVPPDAKDGEAVNLQYSMDGGVPGFDWVLISPRNVADQAKIIELASKLGYQLEEREMNRVRFLRMTGSGISEFGARVIQEVYKIDRNTKFEIMTQGFKWQP
jgi:hypothetical protein